jgi:poly[(R)-3-hydroxyalkanoate] polymerase subunit PhaC
MGPFGAAPDAQAQAQAQAQAPSTDADNKLIRNELVLGARRVDLRAITMPVLNIYATGDTIIPVSCSKGVGAHFGTQDYTEVAVPGGHIGTFVGGKAQRILAPTLAEWFEQRGERVRG